MKKDVLSATYGIVVLVVMAFAVSCLTRIAGVKVVRLVEAAEGNTPYSEIYEIGICTVSVHRDGTGVDIVAVDEEWRDYYALGQSIFITKNPKGGVDVRIVYRMIPKMMPAVRNLFVITIESGTDIFYKNCREEALGLPSEVKKLFFGRYGIE